MKTNRLLSLATCTVILGITIACTPPDTRQADIKAVQAVETAWAKDASLKSAEKFAGYYAPDAMLLAPNGPLVKGRDDIQGALSQMMRDPNFKLNFQGTSASASKGGDMVYTVGKFTLTMTDPKTHMPVTDQGKYMTVYQKQPDGAWKAAADMLNSDLPLGGAH